MDSIKPMPIANPSDMVVVAKTRDLTFFCGEPGVGVVGLGIAMEPQKYKEMVAWGLMLGGGVALSSQRDRNVRTLALLLVLASLKPFGEGKYIRFMVGMATVMRVLRVFEILLDPQHFQDRGAMYTTKFAFLYHDLRRASGFDSEEERAAALRRAIRDIAQGALGLLAVMAASNQLNAPNLLRPRGSFLRSLPAIYLITVLSMLRFYTFISTVEAGYRLHLNYFGLRAPVCFDSPWESQTMQEFWGSRWNLSIAQQLRSVFFKPLAALGYRKTGELFVFSGSALLHMLPIIGLGGTWKQMASTGAFFLCQPILIAFERALPQLLHGRVWVQAAMWGVAPLFALPIFQVM